MNASHDNLNPRFTWFVRCLFADWCITKLKVQIFLPLPTDPTPEKPVISPICTGCEFQTFPDGKRATKMRLYRLHGPHDLQFELLN